MSAVKANYTQQSRPVRVCACVYCEYLMKTLMALVCLGCPEIMEAF